MSAKITGRLLLSSAWLALTALGATSAVAQQIAANDQTLASDSRTGDIETVVVTGSNFNTDVAPAKASLDTMEPQTIINKSYIQDSVSPTADYTTILAIAPSMSGQDYNGPGLSDNGAKNTLRGLSDGNFVMQYDGIPFGDTNGPSHHSESYFPGVTIGSIIVDRGPGNAGNLGAATYGGTVSLFSEDLSASQHSTFIGAGGSWSTQMFNANFQSGDYSVAGMDTRTLINLNYVGSNGYLTLQNTSRQNVLFKQQIDLAPGWKLTAFANYNGLFQHLNDNAGETAAQINTFGETYALQNTNPALSNYANYNPESKKTDMDYLRLQGSVGGIGIDDTFYTYAYINKTISSTDIEQTQADILAGTDEGTGKVILNGVLKPNDVPGYTKQNAYRVWGNILRATDDFSLGWLTGEVRAGLWWEGSTSQRQRKDFDITACAAANCNPWHDNQYSDAEFSAAYVKGGAASATSAFLGDGYYEYREHTDWYQYEPFVELELHPIDGLTITPGFKYIDWYHGAEAPLEQKLVPVVPYYGSFTTTHELPFAMANYKIEQNWSVYAQYAQGIYIPDISTFESTLPLLTPPKAETTTNYQVGTVYYADNWTFDGDLYYIGVDNNYASQQCTNQPSDECFVNTGTAVYKGIEAEGTYAFEGALQGLSVFASASDNYTKTSGDAVKNAPLWTEANGIVYKRDAFKFSLIDKLVGQQYVGKQSLSATLSQFYRLPAYNNMDLKGSYTIGNFDFGLAISNALNERNLLTLTVNDKTAVGSSPFDYTNRGSSLDQYFFAPSRGFEVSVTAHL